MVMMEPGWKDYKAEEIKAKIATQKAIIAAAKKAITGNVELLDSASSTLALLEFSLDLITEKQT